MLLRIGITLFYCLLGIVIAVPVSYFFQSSALQVMSISDYVGSFTQVIKTAARFGAFDVYRNCAVVLMLGIVVLGNLVEKYFKR